MNWNLDAFLSSAIGALIGSTLTLVGVYLSHCLLISRQQDADAEHLKGLLQGIHDEIETLWEAYLGTAGAQIESLQDGEPMLRYWPITQDYFTIYNTNAFFISRVRDHDLRKAIIATYAKARGLIDSFRGNNDLVQKYEYAAMLFMETQTPVYEKFTEVHGQVLIQYSANLKKIHSELKTLVTDLLRRLRKEGIFSPK